MMDRGRICKKWTEISLEIVNSTTTKKYYYTLLSNLFKLITKIIFFFKLMHKS